MISRCKDESASARAANTSLPSAESTAHGTLGEEGDIGGEGSRVGSRETRLGLLFRTHLLRFLAFLGSGVGVAFFWVAYCREGTLAWGRREEKRRGRERA